MTINRTVMDRVIKIYREDAEAVGKSADLVGFAAAAGGRQNMLDRVEAYEAGLNQTLPDFLKDLYMEHYRKETDPNYITYLQLRKKYEPS